MTKTVRIENADTNTSMKVIAEVYDRSPTKAPDEVAPDTLAQSVELVNPGDKVELTLTSTRYLIVKEAPA